MRCPIPDWTLKHRHRSYANFFNGKLLISRDLPRSFFAMYSDISAGVGVQLTARFRAIQESLIDQAREKTAEVLGPEWV